MTRVTEEQPCNLGLVAVNCNIQNKTAKPLSLVTSRLIQEKSQTSTKTSGHETLWVVIVNLMVSGVNSRFDTQSGFWDHSEFKPSRRCC